MADAPQKTITIRYTPAPRTIVYDNLKHSLTPSEAAKILRTVDRTKISTKTPQRPKGGEVYIYRAKIIGKAWRYDGYERCWRSNGTHYYPKFHNLDASKENAVFKIIRHAAFDKTTNAKFKFSRVTYVELSRNDRDNPLVIVQYFGDETAIAVPDPLTQRRISLPKSHNSRCTLRSSSHRRRVTTSEPTRLTAQISESRLIKASQCKVIVDHPHHQSMDIQDSNVASEVSVTSPSSSALDEDLREASAQGDEERVASLLAAGAGVNSVNRVNGWTALHWAAKRDHAHIVSLLLGSGANASIKSAAGKSPADVCTSPKLAKLLNSVGNSPSATKSSSSPADEDSAARSETAPAAARASTTGFVPNYLRNPEFHYARRTAGSASAAAAAAASGGGTLPGSRLPLLLLARVAKSRDPDFIEVELANRSYDGLMDLLCQELGQDPVSVERIRKLPNVRLRNDADVGRLEHGQQLELVLQTI
ncbi:hypothetical protein BOX15_Mlig025226g3 [Macrostomum lignano]|uniref:CG-1 domain-containing protein n=1 Tax=Macrostomum lignano TaxID=282301 RepID=A0A267GCM0_9PLAT|nr:hypothetical protein BOX15_Mlig025226g3 [Macrostomum lignano]